MLPAVLRKYTSGLVLVYKVMILRNIEVYRYKWVTTVTRYHIPCRVVLCHCGAVLPFCCCDRRGGAWLLRLVPLQ